MSELINGYCSRCGRKSTSALRCSCESGCSTYTQDEAQTWRDDLRELAAKLEAAEKVIEILKVRLTMLTERERRDG